MAMKESPMHLSGVNHVAIVTSDLDGFVEFYTSVFDLEVVFAEDTPAFRHAILRTGTDSWLHPAELSGNVHADAIPEMFARGHLDHLALTAGSLESFDVLRQRLIQRSACDGSIDDLGAFQSLWFEDPDGMRVELVVIVDQTLRGIHEPRRLAQATNASDSSTR
jgi:catechol 2,3-dioxygenase-like lactoylglutathione lyase family enzyme